MIRESLHFEFANRRSTDFKLLNVAVSSGLYNEQLFASRSIQETKVSNRDTPYFVRVAREPRIIVLSFAFEETWNDKLIFEIADWLDVEFYQPLSFSEHPDIVYYAMPVDDVELIHNGLRQGYLTLNMRCNSPFAYGKVIASPWKDFSNNTTEQIITMNNDGHYVIHPELNIQKVGNGDISIQNMFNPNEEFLLKGLLDGENIYINGEKQLIETNANVQRYDNFNDNYLTFSYGTNRLIIKGKFKIKFTYQYKFR